MTHDSLKEWADQCAEGIISYFWNVFPAPDFDDPGAEIQAAKIILNNEK